MPKILNRVQREGKVYNMRRCTSEPTLHKKSDGYLNLLKDYTNLLRDYEHQRVVKRIIDHHFDVLKNEFDVLKEEIQNVQKVRCQVCFSVVHNSEAIHMGDCGHGACRPCFVQSVVHTAIHLRKHNDVDTIQESWRCFSCREFNYSFLQYQRGVLTVKYVSCSSELRDDILHNYTTLEKSLKLPSLSQDLENELWQDIPEENMEEQPVMSEYTPPNEETETYIDVRTAGSDETPVENASIFDRTQVSEDLREIHRLQIAEDEVAEKVCQIYEHATYIEESVYCDEKDVIAVAQNPN